MCNRARMRGEPETLFGSAKKLFSERPRDNRFDPAENGGAIFDHGSGGIVLLRAA